MSTPRLLFVHSDLDDAGLTPSEFRILGHYARRAGEDGQAFQSITSTAKHCGLCERTVKLVNRSLVEKGWLSRVARPGMTTAYVPRLLPGENNYPGKNKPGVPNDPNPVQITPRDPVQNAPHEENPIKVILEENPKPRAKRAAGFDATTLPLPFPSDEFRASWSEWVQHLREKKKPLAESAGGKQLRKLAVIGEVRAIAAIDHSIERNWAGIFEPQAAQSAPTAGAGNRREEW